MFFSLSKDVTASSFEIVEFILLHTGMTYIVLKSYTFHILSKTYTKWYFAAFGKKKKLKKT